MEYTDIKALNFSSLKYMATSPLAYQYALTHPRPDTDAMRLGRAVHKLVLEPLRFNDAYEVGGPINPKTNREYGTDTNAWRDFVAALPPGREIISKAEFATAGMVAQAVRAHEDAGTIVAGPGIAETPIVWQAPGDTRTFKARPDWILPGELWDLKTTKNPAQYSFGKSAAEYVYHAQMAFYAWGMSVVNGAPPATVGLIVAQKVPPWDVAVYTLTDRQLAAGEAKFFAWLDRLAVCEATNTWPGVAPKRQALEMPEWALGESDDGMELTIGGENAF